MKILQIYNQQRSMFGGEETAIQNTAAVLRKRGHQVVIVMRSSRDLETSLIRKAGAAINGIYSISAAAEMRRLIEVERPDIVHAHGIYPMWSPSIFPACRSMGVPSVLHVHCHYLTCPNWYHLRNGQICERCVGGKEYWCTLSNCRGSIAESAAYSLRSYVARATRLFADNVSVIVAVSHFLKVRLVQAGYDEEQIRILPNVVMEHAGTKASHNAGDYIAYCGRLSHEKGAHILLEAARKTGLPVRIAGDGPERSTLERLSPPNVTFLGHLDRAAVEAFYSAARFLVLPSLSFEGFPIAAVEAMMHEKCVIASRIGAIPEIVQDSQNGFLFEPGNALELGHRMQELWVDPLLCAEFGTRACMTAHELSSEQRYYDTLLSIYRAAAGRVTGFSCNASAVQQEGMAP